MNRVSQRNLRNRFDTAQGSSIEHGGFNLRELDSLKIDPEHVLDFSVCTNPFGPSPKVHEALAQTKLDQYPDRESNALRGALADKFAISPDRLLIGNGVSELIWLTALAFVRPADQVLVLGPTYGEYARSVAMQRGTLSFWNALEQNHFDLDPQEFQREFDRCLPQVVYLCNPNNPTGCVLAPEVARTWARQNPTTLFVVDEAYQNFSPGLESLVPSNSDNLLILRSMTKDYGLAGLRVGYAVGTEKIISALARVQPPWSVNAFAQAAAVAALHDEEHFFHSIKMVGEAKQALMFSLQQLGFAVSPSATNFILVKVGDAAAFRRTLLHRGMLVRDATSFGLPGWVRLATRKPQDNDRLLALLREEPW